MRILVTGACGFVGRHVLAELTAHGHETIGMSIGHPPPELSPHNFISANITDATRVAEIVSTVKPDACLHLAAWAFAGGGETRQVIDINLMGTANLLEAVRTSCPEARVLVVSTAHVYGMKARPTAIREDDPLTPDSVYAITKAAADNLSLLYARQHGLDIIVARPYNHIGPGQSPQFAIPSFAKQVSAIRKGAPPLIKVGNLDNCRDFTDVRDIVRAYRLLLEKGQRGKAYNIASGHEVRLGDMLSRLCELAGVQPEIVCDQTLFRPTDQSPVLDISRLQTDTGWMPHIPIDQTLSDILELS